MSHWPRIAIVILLVAAVTAVDTSTAPVADGRVPLTCAGERVTIQGTDGDDLIIGTPARDVIHAGDGDDRVFAGYGDDVVCGGNGSDTLLGGWDDDHLIGGTDTTALAISWGDTSALQASAGGPSRDVVIGGSGTDTCEGAYDRPGCEIRGPMLRPHDSPVTWVFELRLHPVLFEYRWHNGWDFGGECGDPLRAPEDGIVTLAGWKDDLAGNAVRIDHGEGVRSAHAHLLEVWVEPGDFVEMGQVFGLVGETGTATECHLHTEIHVDDERIDPVPFWCPARYFRPGLSAGEECPEA
ncbi:MAG: peptidoglycan DD-metalloendopeptidase family protein [Acidimicrobiia bacterium]|nr:peptidoglycan DD-metalloendopeptidase family protein [Acidimicrobiia bacterium]